MYSRFSDAARRPPVFNRIWIVLLLAFPVILYLMPAGIFDNRQSICPSRLLLNLECAGCGMTRAVMHFHHFRFDEAFYYNPGVIAVYPILVILWLRWLLLAFKREKRIREEKKLASSS